MVYLCFISHNFRDVANNIRDFSEHGGDIFVKANILNLIKKYYGSYFPANAGNKEFFFAALNLSIPFLMGLYVFLTPLPLSSLSEICFYVSLSFLLVLLVFKKTDFALRSPLTLPFVLFFSWAAFGLFFTLDFHNTLHDLRAHLLKYLIVFYLLVNYFNSQKKMEYLSRIVVASVAVFVIGGIIIFYFIEGNPFHVRFGQNFRAMYTGFMCFTTVFAATISLHHMGATSHKAMKVFYAFCFFLLCTATLLNQSRGALIGLFLAIAIMCLHRKNNAIILIVAVVILFSIPGPLDRIKERGLTRDVRPKMFRLSWEVIKDYPVFGVGYGGEIYRNPDLIDLKTYNKKLPKKYRQKPGRIVNSTHNTFLDVAIRTGLVGLALFCWITLTSFWMLWDVFRRREEEFFRSWAICLFASFTAFMVQAIFNDALYGTQAIAMYVNLAMIAILWNLARKKQTNSRAGAA
jgi:O-antigen ligase